MRIPIGKLIVRAGQAGGAVLLDTQRAINGHAMFLGVSGTGKTHNLRASIAGAIRSAAELRRPVRVHVFDVHGDIVIPGACEVRFSESSPYGFNPLEINPDPDFGGVRKQIQKFIAAVRRQKVLGPKQEAALRYLLEDLYASRGYKVDDARSWIPDDPRLIREKLHGKESRVYLDVGFDQRERFKSLVRDSAGRFIGGFDGDLKCWWVEREYYAGELLMWQPKVLFKTSPTLDDAVAFVESKLKAQYTGGNGAAIALLQDVNRAAAALNRRITEMSKRGEALEETEANALREKVDAAREKAVAAYDSYLTSIENGRELDEVIKYNSLDVLTSVYERLQNLRAMGIFRPGLPPFDPRVPVWRYDVKPLSVPEQRLFVSVVVSRIFERAVQRGEQNDVVEIIVIDEASRFVDEEEDNILNVLANEARKFGVALWCASQSPEHFPPDFIKNTAMKVILGLDAGDAGMAQRKLGIESGMLDKVLPKASCLVQIKNSGELQADYCLTSVASV